MANNAEDISGIVIGGRQMVEVEIIKFISVICTSVFQGHVIIP